MLTSPPPMHPTLPQPQQPQRGPRGVIAAILAVVLIAVLAFAAIKVRGGGESIGEVLAGAEPSASAGPGAPQSSLPTTAPDPASLKQYYDQKLDWQPCDTNRKYDCTTLLVPVDYTKPDGEAWKIALLRVKASDPSQRIGSLIINPGGPGGSGVQYAENAGFAFTKDLMARYDIVGFDPRGIGGSEGTTCLSDATMDQFFTDDPTPDTPEEKAALVAHAKAATAECQRDGGPRITHMSSTEVAMDMDIMRAALGDKKLHYLGVSYGTFLGALYADLYPGNVGRMVLDSAMSPNQTADQEITYDASGFKNSIDAYLKHCVDGGSCPLGNSVDEARARLLKLLNDVDQDPLTSGSQYGNMPVGEGWVGFATFMSLYSEQIWPLLDRAFDDAFNDHDGSGFLTIAFLMTDRSDNGKYKSSTYLQAMIPVRCADWPIQAESAGVREKLYKDDPLFAKMYGAAGEMCDGWNGPVRVKKTTELGVGAAPIVVIGNTNDPATPLGGTIALSKDLASGHLVEVDHNGHGSYNSGNACATTVVDDYLLDGTVPADGKKC